MKALAETAECLQTYITCTWDESLNAGFGSSSCIFMFVRHSSCWLLYFDWTCYLEVFMPMSQASIIHTFVFQFWHHVRYALHPSVIMSAAPSLSAGRLTAYRIALHSTFSTTAVRHFIVWVSQPWASRPVSKESARRCNDCLTFDLWASNRIGICSRWKGCVSKFLSQLYPDPRASVLTNRCVLTHCPGYSALELIYTLVWGLHCHFM